MAKVLCVPYDDPVDRYPDGQSMPTPNGLDFKPGGLLGIAPGEATGLVLYLLIRMRQVNGR